MSTTGASTSGPSIVDEPPRTGVNQRYALLPGDGRVDEIAGYELLGRLGAGGMGVVHRARDLATGQQVALKVLVPPSDLDVATRRFRREFRAAARLQHPHVARVFDFHAEPPLYYTMELVDGRPLDDALRVAPALLSDASRVASLRMLAGQILVALDAVHSAELIHRDLKPANILVCQVTGELPWAPSPADRSLYAPLADGSRPFVKLLDFGLAWLGDRSGEITRQGMIVGTVDYVSPEQVVGGEVDARADLYSLGIILFELLTGSPPFEARDTMSLLLKHAYETAPRARRVNPDVPPDLDNFVFRLMEKEPADRYPSARAALADLVGGAVQHGWAGSSQARPFRLLPPRIVGRAAELTSIRSQIDEVTTGRSRAIIVVGEAGVGKSTLLTEVQKMARMRGLSVCASAAHDDHGFGYAPFLPVLDTLARDASPAPERGLSQAAATLASLVPRWDERAGAHQRTGTGHADEARVRVLAAVLDVVRHRLSRRGLAIIIDDLQWADPASLELFAYLVRSAATESDQAMPLIMAASLREEDLEPGAPLARWFEALRRTPRVSVIRPDRLGLVGVESMASSMLGADSLPEVLVTWLHNVSQGVPFIVSELLLDGTTDGMVEVVGGRVRLRRNASGVLDFSRQLPQPVTELVGRRLGRLDKGERKVAAAAALVGTEVPFDLLLAATGCGEDELLDRVQELLRQRILVESREDPDLFLFSARVIRDVLAVEDLEFRRRKIHQRIAAAIEQRTQRRPEDVVALAHHLLAAGSKREAVPWLMRTIEFHQLRLATAEALASARSALAILDEFPGESVASRWEIECSVGELEAVMCNYERAAEVFGRVLAQCPSNSSLTASALLGLSGVAASRGDYDEAAIYARRAQEVSTSVGDPLLLTRSHTALGRVAWHHGRPAEALRAFSEALDVDRGRGDEAGQAKALYNIGYSHFAQGAFSQAETCFEESLAISRSRGYLSGIALSLEATAAVAQRRAQYAAGAMALAEARSISHRFGHRRAEAYCALSQGNVACYQASWTEGLAYYDDAEAIFVELGEIRGVANCAINRGQVLTSLGLYRQANDALGQALRLTRRLADVGGLSYCQHALAELWREIEDWEEAARLDRQVVESFRQQGDLYGLGLALAGAAATALGRGLRTQAGELAREALELAVAAGMDEIRIRATILLARLDRDVDAAGAVVADASRLGLRELAAVARGVEAGLLVDSVRADAARRDAKKRVEALAAGLESREDFLARPAMHALLG